MRQCLTATALALLPALVGCGHPATREECEIIFKKSAELAAKSHEVSDPKQIDALVQQALADKKDKLEGCVGRRITKDVLECVPKAETEEALEACLD